MLPEFEEVVFDMKVGETSGIVESGLGYHIIKLTSVREARHKLEYEDVREEIANILMMKKREDVYNNLVTRLQREATIEILDDELAGGGAQMSDSLLGVPY
jgi:parvulin-like peptidyl-prolyl isomerase